MLFGDYNPGGKEPVTWPRSVGQIPIHHYDPPNGRPNIPERGDYKAHWLDEPDEPLFAFGFGLVVQPLRRSMRLELPRRVGRDDTLTVRVRVTNTSDRAGDEVPQLYLRPRVASTVAGKRLVGLSARASGGARIALVEFTLPTRSSRCSIRRITGPIRAGHGGDHASAPARAAAWPARSSSTAPAPLARCRQTRD